MALTPSQRLRLMKVISERLAEEDYQLIDTTLKQFGMQRRDTWSGEKYGYVLAMVEDGQDSGLIDLAEHVGFELEDLSPPRVEPRFWRKDMLKLFVSHLARERVKAAELQEALLDYGISCFVAHNDIEPTQEWQTQIETALATCDTLVALLHEGFHESKWTDQEIGFAMGRGLPVYSIRYGADPYGFIGRFQAFNAARKSAAQIARELFDSYRKDKQTQPKMASVLLSLFEQSSSFAEAKSRIEYLEGLESWEPTFAARLRNAAASNSQISGSWGVPERVNVLAKKWRPT